MTASLSASGLVPISAAIAGSEVAITVESMFSMNRATAMISGTMRSRRMDNRKAGSAQAQQVLEPQSGGGRKAAAGELHNSHPPTWPRNQHIPVLTTHANPKAGRDVARGTPRDRHFISLRQPVLVSLFG